MVLALAAMGLPGRMLTGISYAVERGRIQADSDQLAGVEEVSNAFRTVARVAGPGVVRITVAAAEEDVQKARELGKKRDELMERIERQRENEDADRSTLRDLIRELRDVQNELEEAHERLSYGSGSGIVYDESGHILTNNHVVGGHTILKVELPDDREYAAVLVGSDAKTDLAVLKIDATELHPLKFGDSDKMEVGDWVLAVGAPFGLSQTVSHGIISAKGRTDVIDGRGILYQNFLQTDAAINPGNSGGPLLNLRGEVIGVNTAIATNNNGGYNAGVAFTIPSNTAVKIAEQLKSGGQVVRGWLGITMGDLSPEDRKVLGMGVEQHGGVMVAGVTPGNPADEAGIQYEDVIMAVNGKRVKNLAELRDVIADLMPGDNARMRVFHNGAEQDMVVKVGRRPEDSALNSGRMLRGREITPLGLYGQTLLPSFAQQFGYAAHDRGVQILGFSDESLPRRYDVEPGDLVVSINEAPIRTLADVAKAVQQSKDERYELKVLRDGKTRTVELSGR